MTNEVKPIPVKLGGKKEKAMQIPKWWLDAKAKQTEEGYTKKGREIREELAIRRNEMLDAIRQSQVPNVHMVTIQKAEEANDSN